MMPAAQYGQRPVGKKPLELLYSIGGRWATKHTRATNDDGTKTLRAFDSSKWLSAIPPSDVQERRTSSMAFVDGRHFTCLLQSVQTNYYIRDLYSSL